MFGAMAVRLCDICGRARKSSRSRSRSRRKDFEQDPTTQKHLATRKPEQQTRSRAEANGLVCLAGCAEDLTTRESAWTTASHHNGVDIVATRELSRTDPSTLELLADQAMQGQRQGTTQVKNKDIATWRRSFVETTAWPHAVLGRDQLPVRVCPTVCSGAAYNRGGQAHLETGDRRQRDQSETRIMKKDASFVGGTRFDVLEERRRGPPGAEG